MDIRARGRFFRSLLAAQDTQRDGQSTYRARTRAKARSRRFYRDQFVRIEQQLLARGDGDARFPTWLALQFIRFSHHTRGSL